MGDDDDDVHHIDGIDDDDHINIHPTFMLQSLVIGRFCKSVLASFTMYHCDGGGSRQDHCVERAIYVLTGFSPWRQLLAQIVGNFPAQIPGSWSHPQKPDVKN